MFKTATRLTNSSLPSNWSKLGQVGQQSMFTKAFFSSMQAQAAYANTFKATDLTTKMIDVRKIKP